MNRLPRFRARTEWNGIELFDRIDGKVIALDSNDSELFKRLAETQNRKMLSSCSSRLETLELYSDDEWKVDPIIHTPYEKTPDFASAPRRIYWEFTRKCNLNCKACFNRFFDKEELATDILLKIARQLYDAGVYEIRCTGGEPTIRPDFFEIVAELKNMGFYLSMGTNGIYPQNTLKKVQEAPVDWIIFSIDGSNESTHAKIRGPGNFSRTLNALRHLAEKDCRIRINTLIRKGHFRYRQLKGLAELCDQFKVESLNCIPLRPVTNDPETVKLQLIPIEFREFISGLNRLRQEHQTDFVTTLDLRHTTLHDRIYFKDRSCAAGREGAVISPYGEIYGCSYSIASNPAAPADKRQKYVAGNLLEDDFLEIWNQTERWAIYRDLEKYKHEKCKNCDYYLSGRCIGNCPIMDEINPAAFDPYCYLYLEKEMKGSEMNLKNFLKSL